MGAMVGNFTKMGSPNPVLLSSAPRSGVGGGMRNSNAMPRGSAFSGEDEGPGSNANDAAIGPVANNTLNQ